MIFTDGYQSMGKGFKFFDIEFQTETIVVVFLHG